MPSPSAIVQTTPFPPLDPGPLGAWIDAKLVADNAAAGDRPTADGTPLRASEALFCSRRIAFRIIGFPVDIPMTGDKLMIFELGHIVHERVVQPALVDRFGAELEVKATYMPDFPMSAWLDALYKQKVAELTRPKKVAAEVKSMGDYGFKVITGQKYSSTETPGPKKEHVCQSAIGAMAPNIGADACHIIVLNKGTGEIAEWIYDLDEPLPHLDGQTAAEIATTELQRLAGILGRLDDGLLPKAVIPGHGIVNNPPGPDSRSQPWQCRFCPWQPTCARIGPQPVLLSRVEVREPQR